MAPSSENTLKKQRWGGAPLEIKEDGSQLPLPKEPCKGKLSKNKFLQTIHHSKNKFLQVNWSKAWYQNTTPGCFNVLIKNIGLPSFILMHYACINVFRSRNATYNIWSPPHLRYTNNFTLANLLQSVFLNDNTKEVRNSGRIRL